MARTLFDDLFLFAKRGLVVEAVVLLVSFLLGLTAWLALRAAFSVGSYVFFQPSFISVGQTELSTGVLVVLVIVFKLVLSGWAAGFSVDYFKK
jgi:hypothetical protein